jgi:putative SOS response-associated peptidase YedK
VTETNPTTDLNEQGATIHDQMPPILTPNQYDEYLVHSNFDVLQPFAGPMYFYPLLKEMITAKKGHSAPNVPDFLIEKVR